MKNNYQENTMDDHLMNSSTSSKQNSEIFNDKIINIILEENKTMRKIINQKFVEEGNLISVLDLMEIQRSKIDSLESGKF